MQINDFEKDVQQRMDDLQLYPSAEVWPEVERRIRKEKKRRRFIFWLLLQLLLTGVTIYFLTTTNKKSISSKPDQNQIERSVVEKNNENTLVKDQPVVTLNEQPVVTIIIKDSLGNIQKSQSKPSLPADIKQTGTEIKKDRLVKNDQPVIAFEKRNGGKKKNKPVGKVEAETSLIAKKEKIVPADTVIIEQQKLIVAKQQDKLPGIISDTTSQAIVQVNKTSVPNDTTQSELKPIARLADSSVNSNKPDPLAKTNKNKWKIGVTVITGLSDRAGGLFLGGEKSLSTYAPGGGAAALASYTKDSGKPGLFWEAGAYIQNNSKKKTSVSFGLSVSSFTHGQRTGSFRDSVNTGDANGFYRPGNSLLYNNRYYYLQLPVMIHWQLNRGNKFPLVWQNGFSPSLLLGSNALTYNSSLDIYYRDKSSLNKVQLAFRSGLYTRFAAASKHPLSAGLFFNYNLSGFQKRYEYDRNHQISFGVQYMMKLKKD